MISLQTAPPLHENCLHPMTLPFTENPLPEGWTIKSGKVAPWGQQPGGATQLQVIKDDGSFASVNDLIKHKILKGKEHPVGLS